LHETGNEPAIPGDDVAISNINNTSVNLKCYTNQEFGDVSSLIIYLGTPEGEKTIALPYSQSGTSITLNDLIYSNILYNPENIWFYLRAEMETKRNYTNQEAVIFKKHTELFHCFTNPIWFKINNSQNICNDNFMDNNILIYPNPAREYLNVYLNTNDYITDIEIFTITGSKIISSSNIVQKQFYIDISALHAGFYILKIKTNKNIFSKRFIVE